MNKIKLFFKSILLIILYLFISIFMYTISYKYIFSNNFFLSNFSTLFSDLFVLFIFIIIFRKKLIPDFYDFKKNYKKYLTENFKYWLLGLLLMNICNTLITTFIQIESNNQNGNIELLFSRPISSIVSMILCGPIIEELITRKTFRDVFNNEHIYIFFSGLIFGSMHLLSATSLKEIFYIFPYGILGAFFAKMYYKTNNIWTNISFHAIHNAIAISLIYYIGV